MGRVEVVGSILLIHGSAPFNVDGRVPDPRAGKYADMTFFKDIAAELEALGWKVFRYAKPGVNQDSIDFLKYRETDLEVLGTQMLDLWQSMPKSGPRVVFAWSEGSLHIHQLPLHETDGVFILGGIATNIRDVILWQAKDKNKMLKELDEIRSLPRTHMIGLDRPAGRLVDEFDLQDNWSFFLPYPELPLLIAHGMDDAEVPFEQSVIWAKKLPHHAIERLEGSQRNHAYGKGSGHGAKILVQEAGEWLKRIASKA